MSKSALIYRGLNMGWMIKELFLLFCLMLLFPVSVYASFKGLHPPMEIETELLAPSPIEDIEGMVFIKGGCYEMGDTSGHRFVFVDEIPVHMVCVDDFYIGKYEVTQREWVFVMGGNPSHFTSCDNCPVENVSWDDVHEFIQKLNKKTGRQYRLPTEAEWEYAARSGGKKEIFAGFYDEEQLYLYSNFCDSNCESEGKIENQNDRYRNTSPVGTYRPNGLGLYDMTGNVSERVWDWYGEDYYRTSPKDNPKGPNSGQYRVVRGGSWHSDPWGIRVSFRGYRGFTRLGTVGFRLALSPP